MTRGYIPTDFPKVLNFVETTRSSLKESDMARELVKQYLGQVSDLEQEGGLVTVWYLRELRLVQFVPCS